MKKISFCLILCLTFFTASFGYGLTTFTPRLSVEEEFTDNLHLSENNKVKELIITPSASLRLDISSRTNDMSLTYSPAYSFYENYTDYNSFRQSAQLNAGSDLAKNTRFEIYDSFLQTEDPVTEDDYITRESLITETQGETVSGQDYTLRLDRRTYYRNTAGAKLSHQYGPKDSVAFDYQYITLENDDPNLEDNQRHRPSILLTHWINPGWGTQWEGIYEKAEFDESADTTNIVGRFRLTRVFTRHLESFVQYRHVDFAYDGDRQDYRIYDPSLGVNWKIDKDTTLSLAAGYYIRDLENGGTDSGLTLSGDLGKNWRFKRGFISITGSSGYDQSYYGAENLGFSQYYQVRGTGNYSFTRHLSGNIFGSYRHTKYEDLAEDRKDKITSAGGGLNYQLAPWLFSKLSYTYRNVNSDEDRNEYDENRVSLMFSVSPSTPYKL